jgi:hypothetical protein
MERLALLELLNRASPVACAWRNNLGNNWGWDSWFCGQYLDLIDTVWTT